MRFDLSILIRFFLLLLLAKANDWLRFSLHLTCVLQLLLPLIFPAAKIKLLPAHSHSPMARHEVTGRITDDGAASRRRRAVPARQPGSAAGP